MWVWDAVLGGGLSCFLQVPVGWGCFVQAALERGMGEGGGPQALPEAVVMCAFAASEGQEPLTTSLLWSQTVLGAWLSASLAESDGA